MISRNISWLLSLNLTTLNKVVPLTWFLILLFLSCRLSDTAYFKLFDSDSRIGEVSIFYPDLGPDLFCNFKLHLTNFNFHLALNKIKDKRNCKIIEIKKRAAERCFINLFVPVFKWSLHGLHHCSYDMPYRTYLHHCFSVCFYDRKTPESQMKILSPM